MKPIDKPRPCCIIPDPLEKILGTLLEKILGFDVLSKLTVHVVKYERFMFSVSVYHYHYKDEPINQCSH